MTASDSHKQHLSGPKGLFRAAKQDLLVKLALTSSPHKILFFARNLLVSYFKSNHQIDSNFILHFNLILGKS